VVLIHVNGSLVEEDAVSDAAFFRSRAELYRKAATLIGDACLASELRGMARVYSAQAERLQRVQIPSEPLQ
jgi:hypothetical protein